MRPGPWVPLAVLAVFLTEIVVFIGLGNLIGYPAAVLLILVVSLIGLVLVRREGLRAWRGFRRAAEAGARPGPQITDGLVGLGGALLLATPGLVTGLAGAVLLTPPLRGTARRRVQSRAERRMSSAGAADIFGPRRVRVHVPPRDDAGAADSVTHDEPVVEGEVIDPDDPPRARP